MKYLYSLTLLLFFSLLSRPALCAAPSPVEACRENRFFSAIASWDSVLAMGTELSPAEQSLRGVAYANLALIAEKAFPIACRLTAAGASILMKSAGNGELLFLKGISLFALTDYAAALDAFKKAGSADKKLKASADFWSRISALLKDGKPLDWDKFAQNATLAGDVAIARAVLNGGRLEDPKSCADWWKSRFAALREFRQGKSAGQASLPTDAFCRARTVALINPKRQIEINDPYDLLFLKFAYAGRAKTELEIALKNGNDENASYFLGRMLFLLGDYQKAEERLISIQNERLKPKAQVYIAAAWYENAQLDSAKTKWVELLSSPDEYSQSEAALMLYASNSDRDAAKRTLQKICRNEKAIWTAFMNMADICVREKDYETARRYIAIGYDARNRGVSGYNKPAYLLVYAECCYLNGSLEYPISTETLYLLQAEFPFLRGLHNIMQLLFADSIKQLSGTGAVKYE